jgi:hypothetical protein
MAEDYMAEHYMGDQGAGRWGVVGTGASAGAGTVNLLLLMFEHIAEHYIG